MKITMSKPIPKEAVCNRCGSSDNLTKDHIIPQMILKAMYMPTSTSDNLQVLCRKCNLMKSHKLDPKNPKTIHLLKKYVNRWEEFFLPERKKNVYHVYRDLTVKSLTPNTYYFEDSIKSLEGIYKRQHLGITSKQPQ